MEYWSTIAFNFTMLTIGIIISLAPLGCVACAALAYYSLESRLKYILMLAFVWLAFGGAINAIAFWASIKWVA